MKIVHISHVYHPSSGGVQTWFKNVSERLVRDYNDEVTVVTTDSYNGPEKRQYKEIPVKEEVINGVKVIRFSFARWYLRPLKKLSKVFKYFKIKFPEKWTILSMGPYSTSMRNYLETVNADVFCGSSTNYYYMQLPLWRKCRFFYFASIHLEEDKRKDHILKKQLECINASTLYLANTTFEKERMIELGVNREKIFVLGCGVEMKPFVESSPVSAKMYRERLGIPTYAVVVGYVGRIEQTKNVRFAIYAFEKLAAKYPNAYLLIAGSATPHAIELQEYCKGLAPETNNRIKWHTGFPSSDKESLFNSIDMLVLPSVNESFGLVFLEAWSCKKPVIGSSIGAVISVISDKKDGFITKSEDTADLAEKMEMLVVDEDLRKQMGENGFKKVQENYTWDIIVSRLRKCYSNSLENQN